MSVERRTRLGVILVALAAAPAAGQQSVVDSVHNLSAAGPGEIRAAIESEVCIFCHTPHRASTIRQLWNRELPVTPYTVYASSALDAAPGQPTGASKMCLSCHDGSIALGAVLSRDRAIPMAGAVSALPAGAASNLGTDLSDDHPISFRYDALLATEDSRLLLPLALPEEIRLDRAGEMQCTTCHDPHDDANGDFLVMDNTGGRLCTTCHQIADTTVAAHQDCRSCHRTHGAPSGPFLLAGETVTETCIRCHDGTQPRAGNILADLAKFSVHDTAAPIEPSDPSIHTTCTDCHEPHTMLSGAPAHAPQAAWNFGRLGGPSGSPDRLESAAYEYQVCFRCHGDRPVRRGLPSPWAKRQIVQTSVQLQFDPAGASFHPVIVPGRDGRSPSLRPEWSGGRLVLCSDCHGSDTSRKAGGSGPNGVHGSNYPPLLLDRYETIDSTPESSAAYALCYRCHLREGPNGVLGDRSFPHHLHVVEGRATCATCHDAHGINGAQGNRINNSHLINFDTSIVFPDPVSGRLAFEDLGIFRGTCTLTCHGVVHQRLGY